MMLGLGGVEMNHPWDMRHDYKGQVNQAGQADAIFYDPLCVPIHGLHVGAVHGKECPDQRGSLSEAPFPLTAPSGML